MNTACKIRNHICLPLASILSLNSLLFNAMADSSEIIDNSEGASEISIETSKMMLEIVDRHLLEALSSANPTDALSIRISFESPTVMNVEEDSTGSFGSDSDEAVIDGVAFSESAFDDYLMRRQELRLYKGALREVARRAMMEG